MYYWHKRTSSWQRVSEWLDDLNRCEPFVYTVSAKRTNTCSVSSHRSIMKSSRCFSSTLIVVCFTISCFCVLTSGRLDFRILTASNEPKAPLSEMSMLPAFDVALMESAMQYPRLFDHYTMVSGTLANGTDIRSTSNPCSPSGSGLIVEKMSEMYHDGGLSREDSTQVILTPCNEFQDNISSHHVMLQEIVCTLFHFHSMPVLVSHYWWLCTRYVVVHMMQLYRECTDYIRANFNGHQKTLIFL